jgi:hypothetical protein
MMPWEGNALGLCPPWALFICFERVFEVVDNALFSATEAQKKTSKVAEKFKMAIDALRDYETKYHLNKVVTVRMEKAEEVDKSSSELLNRLKSFRVRKKLALFCRHTDVDYQPMKEEPTKIVEFHIHKSLPDSHPAIQKRERRLTKVAHGIWHLYQRFSVNPWI